MEALDQQENDIIKVPYEVTFHPELNDITKVKVIFEMTVELEQYRNLKGLQIQEHFYQTIIDRANTIIQGARIDVSKENFRIFLDEIERLYGPCCVEKPE